jgi:hypothetical protein
MLTHVLLVRPLHSHFTTSSTSNTPFWFPVAPLPRSHIPYVGSQRFLCRLSEPHLHLHRRPQRGRSGRRSPQHVTGCEVGGVEARESAQARSARKVVKRGARRRGYIMTSSHAFNCFDLLHLPPITEAERILHILPLSCHPSPTRTPLHHWCKPNEDVEHARSN